MHLVWWIVWIIILVWIFAIPYDLTGQPARKDTPPDIMKMRFASALINKEE
jgi:putative membrane protein